LSSAYFLFVHYAHTARRSWSWRSAAAISNTCSGQGYHGYSGKGLGSIAGVVEIRSSVLSCSLYGLFFGGMFSFWAVRINGCIHLISFFFLFLCLLYRKSNWGWRGVRRTQDQVEKGESEGLIGLVYAFCLGKEKSSSLLVQRSFLFGSLVWLGFGSGREGKE
jgi:hypothetical protein